MAKRSITPTIGSQLAAGLALPDKFSELSKLELELIVARHSVGRWMMRCMVAATGKEMTETEILVVHHVNHRCRERKLADICFALNIEDTHVVSYALKKLANLDLVSSNRRGKELFWSTTVAGRSLCKRYFQMRDDILLRGLIDDGAKELCNPDLTRILRTLSEHYDQGARAAASI